MATISRKTILALAIAAAAHHAHADVIDVTGPLDMEMMGGTYNGVTLTGTANRNVANDGIDFYGSQINGDFISEATFNLNGNYVDAIGLDDDNGAPVITGSFENKGTINAEGYNAAGIKIANTTIGQSGVLNDNIGNVINSGTINVIDTSGRAADDDEIAGILIEHSHLYGDLKNQGTITVQGVGAWGIKVDGQNLNPADTVKYATIDRDVVNTGTISVTGPTARGLELSMVNFGKDVENAGTINVNGANSAALRMDRSNYNRIVNTGTIRAEGSGSIGVEIRESFGNNALNQGIINNGTITADGVGIKVTNDLLQTGPGETSNVDNFYRITQNAGTIRGGESAIDGNGQTILHLNGGTVIGNIEGIREAFVNGDVAIYSGLIEASKLDVAAGKLYVAEVTNVTGDMFVRNGAGLSLFVNDSTNASNAIVKVDGKLTLEQGSVIGVTTNPGQFSKEVTKYVLVSADQLENLGVQVKTLTPLLAVTDVAFETNSITANIGLATGGQAAEGLAKAGVDRNGIVATKAFIDSVLAKLPVNSNLYQAFINANDAELRQLASQLQPETNRAAQSASLAATGLTNSAIGSRASSLGANSGDALVETGAWVKVLRGNSDQGSRGGIAGYDADSTGLIIGADGKLNEQTTLGLALSHVRTDVSSDSGNDTDVSTTLLTAYGAWEQGPYSVLGSLSYGKSDNESKRYIAGERAKGDYDSNILALDLSAGYTIKLNDNLDLIPTLASRYAKVQIDSFTEKGTAAALRTSSQSLEVFDVGGGFKLEGVYGDFKPSARLMAFHDFAQDSANATSSYALGGATFATTGAPATKWTYEAGIGLDWTKGNYTIGASYDYTRKADFNADTMTLKARYDF